MAIPKTKVNTMLTDKEVKHLKRLAAEEEVSRAQALRGLVRLSMNREAARKKKGR